MPTNRSSGVSAIHVSPVLHPRSGGIARRLPSLAGLGLAALLAGCGSSAPQFPPACPRTSIVSDAADLTVFQPAVAGQGGQDLTDTVLDGRLTGISGSCTRNDDGKLEVIATVSMDLSRGPAATQRSYDVPFFLAVTEGQQILEKQVFRIHAEFPANTDRLRIGSDQVSLLLPITREKTGAAYDVLVGFQLTPDQLEINRRRGPR